MPKIKPDKLRAGMVISKPIYSKEGAPLMLPKSALTEKLIQRIGQWQVPFVEVEYMSIH